MRRHLAKARAVARERLDRKTVTRWVAMVAVVALASWLTPLLPKLDDAGRAPFLHRAELGQWVRLRTGQVRVTGVEYVSAVQLPTGPVSTTGVFVVAHLERIPETEPLPPVPLVVRDSAGRTFGDDGALNGTCVLAQPGLVLSCSQLVELPADALGGAELWVPAYPDAWYSFDDVAVFPLAPSATRLEQVTLPEAEVRGQP